MTSTASNSALDIASRALVLIGAEPITSFETSSTEALVAPTGRFDIAHQLPSDLIMLHTVTINDNAVSYTVYGDKVFSDSSTNDVLVADYTYRASETDFPSYFALAVQYSLASVFATAIARDDKLMEMMEVKAERLMAKARNLDSQQQTSRSLSTTRFRTNRRS